MPHRPLTRISTLVCITAFILCRAEAAFAQGGRDKAVAFDTLRFWQEIEQWREEWENGYNDDEGEDSDDAEGSEDADDAEDSEEWENGYNDDEGEDSDDAEGSEDAHDAEDSEEWENGYNDDEGEDSDDAEDSEERENGYNDDEGEDSDDAEDSEEWENGYNDEVTIEEVQIRGEAEEEERPSAPVRRSPVVPDDTATVDETVVPEPTWWQVPRATLPEEAASGLQERPGGQAAVPAQGGGALFLEFDVPDAPSDHDEPDEEDYEDNTDPETQIS